MKTSVALCTYNGEKYLREQLDSILNQTVSVDEIVICDDKSSDGTHDIINQYCIEYPNLIKFHINEVNLRSVKNFEKAISLCHNEIIFLSDQDDIWVKEKVEEYIIYFEQNAHINVLASNGYCINDNFQVEEKYAIWDVPEFLKNKKIEINYFNLITYVSNIATGASIAFRKEIITEIIPFPIIKEFHHDEWIAIVSSLKNAFEILNKKYFYYRIHDNQQVGGVFFDKNQKEKLLLTEIFDYTNYEISFSSYKKRLKKIINSYNRIEALLDFQTILDYRFILVLLELEELFNKTKIEMKKRYIIKSSLLNFTDKILKKRQLN